MASVVGLSERRLAKVRGRLDGFAADMFEGALVRAEQRRWSGVYLRGLMLDGKRKSIEPIAARLEDGDEQGLQQFVNQSPWDERVVRSNLARRMCAEIEPVAWIVDDTGFVKKGRFSVGVTRQYSGTLGRVDNCQVGVSINAASDAASCPLDWRIFLPEAWDEDLERRGKAHVPDDVRHREKWRLALDMIDELGAWGLVAPLIAADAGYGEITAFRQGLDDREIPYVVQVKRTTSAYPERARRERLAYQGMGRPPTARYRTERSSLKELALRAGKRAAKGVTWREGSRGRMHSRFLALRVRPDRLLALEPPAGHRPQDTRAPRQAALADRARLSRAQARARPRSLRGPQLPRLAPPRHLRLGRSRLPDPGTPAPENQGGSLTLYALLRELQRLIACWHGHCPTCRRPLPPTSPLRGPP